MGKTFKRTNRSKKQSDSNLTEKPFKDAFKGIKVGSLCLKCHEPIDTRESWSLANRRGSHKLQRHGWMHFECECESAVGFAKEQGKTFTKDDGAVIPWFGVQLSVPVLDKEDIDNIVNSSTERS